MILNTGEYIRTSHEHLGGVPTGQLVVTWRKLDLNGACLDMGSYKCTPTEQALFEASASLPILEFEQAMQDYIVANF
jgi:hypothetical protein